MHKNVDMKFSEHHAFLE